jgi:hypothetical protein
MSMRPTTLFAGAAAIALMASSAMAQGSNLAGRWVLPPNSAPPAGDGARGGGGGGRGGGGGGRGGAPGLGPDFTISQDAKILTITRINNVGDTLLTVYNLDGTESRNTVQNNNNNNDVLAMVKWEGSRLVITTIPNNPAAAGDSAGGNAGGGDAGGNARGGNARGGGGGGGNNNNSPMTIWIEGGRLRVQTPNSLTIYNKG